nr:1D [Potamipivirus A]
EMGDGVVEDNTAAAASSAGMVAPEEMDKEDYLNEHNPGTGYAMRIQKVQIMRAVHTNINALFGRAQYVGRYTVGADTGHVFDLPIPVAGYWNIPKMFHFFTGDLNIHIYNATEGPVKVAHSYTKMTESSLEFISSLGCVVVPTQQFASLTVPWYFDKPVRYFRGERPLGNIILYTLGHGKVFVWISFTNLKLFQPIGVPK